MFPFGYIALVALFIAFVLFVGRDKPPKGQGNPAYKESRERVWRWRLIWRSQEGQDKDKDWSRD